MLMTVTAHRSPALPTPGDLGYLLHKHPDRAQSFPVYGGRAHVVYPEVTETRCTAALLVDIDPVELVRGRRGAHDGFVLGQYVNDRPYVASSLLAVAMGKVFRSALNGRCDARPDLVDADLDLTVALPVVPGDDAVTRGVFAPMGWQVATVSIPLDATRPEWGDAPAVSLTLTGTMRLSDALSHLYVLLPALDGTKHYWVGDAEVEKLVRAGSGWLATHPENRWITRRYLAHQRDLADAALARLTELDDLVPEEVSTADMVDDEVVTVRPLVHRRQDAVMDVVAEVSPTTVVDLGCGQGSLLRRLLPVQGIDRVVGTDVSDSALATAARRLHVDRMTERQADRLSLYLSSLMYVDERLEGMDLAILMEVVEHIDPLRLPEAMASVFGSMRPRHVVVTTPNIEYNVRYPSVYPSGFRHVDHRFEWTRAEFAEWVGSIGDSYGYAAEIRPVGDVDEVVGPPTQMAVFHTRDHQEVTR
jgi:3' terminal RNA ribose 2'-O-methyltransferase Hen1